MTGNELRRSFIEFFESKKHQHFESASLIPEDKTLLLTVAGMVPFKKFFLGEKKAPTKRVTTYQKCIRTNDLENVGRTPRHHTFFEMLGNFSFGDYFKKEAICWSWEYITEVLKIDKDRLYVSVYKTDDEAYNIWKDEIGIDPTHIVRLGDEDNWWAAGPIGSCGPCSEIYYDTLNMGKNNEEINCKPGDEGDRFLEIWNLVFTEWNRKEDGSLVPLPEKNIDTGAGLERVASVVQHKSNNFDTDIFENIIKSIKDVVNLTEKDNTAIRIIADHVRAATFLICDGVLPSNEGRGYILKKLIRRAYGAGSIANKEIFNKGETFLYKIVDSVVETMKEAYPELVDKKEEIKDVIQSEEEKFAKTLKAGTELLLDDITKGVKIDGSTTFKLYDTFGFPFELTKLVCEQHNIEVSEEEFNKKLEEQVQRSKSSRVVMSDMIKDEFISNFYKQHGETKFTGYETLKDRSEILHISKKDEDTYEMIFDKTPFYAAQGGQVSDHGVIYNDSFKATVKDLIKKSDIFIHYVTIDGEIPSVGDVVELEVDKDFRAKTMRNHTATHILHRAVKEILGDHVNQAGSLVYDKGLRFDFTYGKAIDKETLRKIERRVNEIIQKDMKLEVTNTTKDVADKMGAIALFDEKYKDIVRVVDIVGYSAELCGGTHCPSTGVIGSFYILSEQAKASGVRRIEAVTGFGAYDYVNENRDLLQNVADEFKTDVHQLQDTVKKSIEKNTELEKEVENLKDELISHKISGIISEKKDINGVSLIVKKVKAEQKDLKTYIDKIKNKVDNVIVLLATVNDDKIGFACGVSKELTKKYKAGDIVKTVAQITGGNGGGKPDFAQAGGKDVEKLNEALEKVENEIIM